MPCLHSRTALSCAALFSLCSHHPWLSPPISPDSYLSVITDLKRAQTLSVTTHTYTHTSWALHCKIILCLRYSSNLITWCAFITQGAIEINITLECNETEADSDIFSLSLLILSWMGWCKLQHEAQHTATLPEYHHYQSCHWFKVEPETNRISVMWEGIELYHFTSPPLLPLDG